jgi:hypothetical protein
MPTSLLRASPKPVVRWFALRSFSHLGAVLGILPIEVRLFHQTFPVTFSSAASRAKPFGLESLAIVGKCLLRDLVLSHRLLGIDVAKCLTGFSLEVIGLVGATSPGVVVFVISSPSTLVLFCNNQPERLRVRFDGLHTALECGAD